MTFAGFGSQPYNDGYQGRQDRSVTMVGGGVAVRGHHHFAKVPNLVLTPAIGAGLIAEWYDATSAGGSIAGCELAANFAAPYLEADLEVRVELGRHSIVLAPVRFSVMFPSSDDGGSPRNVDCFGGFHDPISTPPTTPARFFGADQTQAHAVLFSAGYALVF